MHDQDRIQYRIRDARESIAFAPDNYTKAQAALACEIMKIDGSPYFDAEIRAYSNLALVDELRKSRGL